MGVTSNPNRNDDPALASQTNWQPASLAPVEHQTTENPSVASQPTAVQTAAIVSSAGEPIEKQSSSDSVWEFGKHCLELDGVRGIAILGVTLYRFSRDLDVVSNPALSVSKAFLSFGSRGVDLFFVLSGFLITGILLKTKCQSGYFRNFIARRALRIFPLYFAALLVCLYVIPSVSSTQVFDLPKSHQFYLWTYTPNVWMAWQNSWCFGPLDHFWSLAVEEHFYLLWPFVVYFLSLRALFHVSIFIAVAACATRMFASMWPEMSVAVDVLTVFRCDALCMGAILAVVMVQRESLPRIKWLAMCCLPILAIVSLALFVTDKRWMTLPHTVIPALMAVSLAIVVTGKKSDRLSRCLRSSFLRWFGKYSYGMYVVQQPLLSLLPISSLIWALGLEGVNLFATNVLYLMTMVALTCALAYVSYHQFESRFLSLKRYF